MFIGVVYLAPSLGYKDSPGRDEILRMAIEDCQIYFDAGADAVLLENENDRPYTLLASPQVIACMTDIASEVVKKFPDKKIGVEFLLNDPKASLIIAHASGAHFIRTDYFVDRMSRPEYGGEMWINPTEVIHHRNEILKARNIKIFTDIQVKYAAMLEEKSLSQSAREAEENESDGIVVSGTKTGIAPSVQELMMAKAGALETKIIIGSGLNCENIKELKPFLDIAIAGSSMMENGRPVFEKAKKLIQFWNQN